MQATLLDSVNRGGNKNKYDAFVAAQLAGQLDDLNIKTNEFSIPLDATGSILVEVVIDPSNINDTTKLAAQIDVLNNGTWTPFVGMISEGPWTEGNPSFSGVGLNGKTLRIRLAVSATLKFGLIGTW